MTNTELLPILQGLKYNLLNCYKTYFDKMSIGSLITGGRQRQSLKAVSLYIRIVEYYYNIQESDREDTSPITEDEVLVIINEADKLLDTFKSSYYVS